MGQIYSDDAYCIGLLYGYMFGGKRKMLLKDLKKFHEAIEENLKDKCVLDMWCTTRYQLPCIYYKYNGKNNDVYLCLDLDVDIKKAINKYIYGFSQDTINASIQKNALACLGLRSKKGIIQPIVPEMKDRKVSNDFLDRFIDGIKSGEITISDNTLSREFTNNRIVDELENVQESLNNNTLSLLKKNKGLIKRK